MGKNGEMFSQDGIVIKPKTATRDEKLGKNGD